MGSVVIRVVWEVQGGSQQQQQQQLPVVPLENLQAHTDLSLHPDALVQSESTTWPLASQRLLQEGGVLVPV